MTREDMKNMNIKQAAESFLSNNCGVCSNCVFSDEVVFIGEDAVTLCHLMYSVLREDRKQDIKIQASTIYGINEKGEIKCLK